MHETISANPEIQNAYDAMRAAGESHALAEMLALRTFPGVRGLDSDFNKGRCNGEQFANCPALGDHFRRVAEGAGVSTTGKTYLRGLAEYPGDPAAWVSGTSDVLRVARERGLRVEGAVDYTPPAPARGPDPDVPVAADIVEARVDACLEADPGARREDVRERVAEVLSGAVDLENPTPRKREGVVRWDETRGDEA
jgi:hypothetical protein